MATKNITVSVDVEIHRQARIRAAEMGTSLSALVREYLRNLCSQPAAPNPKPTDERLENVARRVESLEKLLDEWKAKGIGIDPNEILTREELYEEVMRERGLVR